MTQSMDSVLQYKPSSILDVVNPKIFIELGDHYHDSYIKSKDYYEIHWALIKHYQPTSLLEIGVRLGYSFGVFIEAGDKLQYVEGWDINQYVPNSIKIATDNLKQHLTRQIDWKIIYKNSQKIGGIDRVFDMIYVDGDHSYEGKKHDLELTRGKCKIVALDDYGFFGDVTKACDNFVKDNKRIIKTSYSIKGSGGRGFFVIEYS